MDSMRILFTRFPLESVYGGAEVQTMALMQGLIKKRRAVAFLGSCPTLLKLCWDEGIPVAELKIGPPPVTKWTALSFTWRKNAMQAKLKTALEELHDIDAIVMLSLSEKLLLTPIALQRGIRVLWIEHDGIGRWLTRNPWFPRLKELAKSVTTIVVSDLSKRMYTDLGWPAERTVSIPNGVDLSRFSPTPYLLPPNPDEGVGIGVGGRELRLGTIARLTEDKGVDLLIDAVTDLPEVSLTIVGKGREEGFLRKLLDERGLTDRVSIQPDVEDLGAFYRSLDAFVLPSRTHDPFGLVAAEAMMLGISTIVTDQCGIARHIEPGKEALVVEANSAPALKQAITELLSRERRASLAHIGKCAARERFSLERMVDAYEKAILE